MKSVFHLVWVRPLHDSKDFYLVWATAGLCKLSYLELEPLGIRDKGSFEHGMIVFFVFRLFSLLPLEDYSSF